MRTILAGMLLCTALAGGDGHAQSRIEPAYQPTEQDVERGKALTEAGNCAGCHTADPAKPFAGGKRIDSPFGGIYSANLTPDRETGLGAWSDDDFLRALRLGVARDGSRYYPAFPYPHFTRLTRQDILAIRAHLATLPPVSNPPRAAELRFPFNWRIVMRGWNWLFLTPGFLMPDQMKARSGIAAAIWSRASRIAAAAIRQRTSSARIRAAQSSRAASCRARPRHGWTPPSKGSNRGAWKTSPPICRTAATARSRPAA